MAAATIDDTDVQLRAIISNLFVLIVQAHEYQGPATQNGMSDEIKSLVHNLLTLAKTAQRLPTKVPVEIVQYVENARNPDIYTREFVELCMKLNQQHKGRSQAYTDFRDILAKQIAVGIPEMKDEVGRVVEASGGKLE